MNVIWVGACGVVGVLLRYSLGIAAERVVSMTLPVTTLAINVLGSFLIGLVYVFGNEAATLSPELRVGLSVGLLGGFTTFSTYALELVRLAEAGQLWLAGLYFGLSTGLGMGAAFAGILLARRLTS